ncbi:DUF1002 domain-containing protein [uncultured Methanobrevibacter sp.]|uniref:DUF1002 domain-containing protein n=1 Tax=uncultured Methanobrevibacter sp. TaxID=253161 RepID=UPI0025CC7309|nr:DUF1002 domain-containing protein [uncultured Methanobrevibacter sp.]
MRKSIIALILVILMIAVIVPTITSADSKGLVVCYGETTYGNQEYKNMVDNFFNSNSHVNLKDADVQIVYADDVNAISSGISQETYGSDEVLSSALIDLNNNQNMEITVDTSKITLVTSDMYASALKSVGITKGYVYVTSPVEATGESALAGILKSYEEATNVQIPDDVKQAANQEIEVESQIVKDSNVSGDDVAKVVNDVKEEVKKDNITDKDNIVTIINNVAVNNNIEISESDVNKLADTISQSHCSRSSRRL